MKKHIVLLLAIPLFLLTSCQKEKKEKNIFETNFNFAYTQFTLAMRLSDSIVQTLDEGKAKLVSPRTIRNGGLSMVASGDWTSGFFAGSLWYLYEYTKEEKWKTAAQKYTAPLEDQKTNERTHDMGFKVYNSFGNGYRLTHDEHYKEVILESAYTLASRYNPHVKALRSWDHSSAKWEFPVIIDNMMNLELLFWAFNQSGDSLFYTVATEHANTTIKNHFRKDYSSYHVIGYDAETGEVVAKNTHQGLAHESAWARGQAWAAYGYAMCYRFTQKEHYLEQAKNVVRYMFSHPNMPQDLIAYWDFDAPNIPNEPRDVSAATVTASALYELCLYDAENKDKYIEWANTILQNLTANYRATEGGDCGFLLLHSTGSKPHNSEVDVPLSYADYYYLEALLRKQKLEEGISIF